MNYLRFRMENSGAPGHYYPVSLPGIFSIQPEIILRFVNK